MSLTTRDIIDMFGMERHHTSGWFSLHYSDTELLGRPKFSSIYYLLPGNEPMPLHKLDGIEVWHYYMGAPAEFIVTNGSGMREESTLGDDLSLGQRPQLAVPAFFWKSCRSFGDWTLLGCTLSPGYSSQVSFIMDAQD